LSGPSFALEVAKRLPTAVTLASDKLEAVAKVQQALATPYFRSYTSKDVAGVEFAGSLKNVVAIASGIVTGLNLGYNAQAALINRGIAEIMRIAKAFHADPFTFLGLAGTGDLILTCTGPLSRNRKVGVLLGEGKKLEEIQKELGGVAEGVYTAKSAFELSQKAGIELPITEQVYRILYENSTPAVALQSLMGRELKEEW
jgi:glycerol-3-phosphate dehydrogenase (NAD(P)+)